jgi:hypothetical protein
MRDALMADLEAVEKEELVRRRKALMTRDVREQPVLRRLKEKKHQAALHDAFEANFSPGLPSAHKPEEAPLQQRSSSTTPAPAWGGGGRATAMAELETETTTQTTRTFSKPRRTDPMDSLSEDEVRAAPDVAFAALSPLVSPWV